MQKHPGLVIRREQMETFQRLAEETFVKETMEYLRENHADAIVRLPTGAMVVEQLHDESLREIVQNGIARARQYEIDWQSTLRAFVVIMFVSAPNFDEHPLIRQILQDEETEANLRLNQLWEQTNEGDWITVEEGYDADAWYKTFREDTP